MKNIKRVCSRFLGKQEGMSSPEYAVMIGLIIVFCSSSISFLGGETESLFDSFNLSQTENQTVAANVDTGTQNSTDTSASENNGTTTENNTDQQTAEDAENTEETESALDAARARMRERFASLSYRSSMFRRLISVYLM